MVQLIAIWSGSVHYLGIYCASREDGSLAGSPAFNSSLVEATSD